jgi:hypothetical protein
MTDRGVKVYAESPRAGRSQRSWLAFGVGATALLAGGVVVGTWIDSPAGNSPQAITVTASEPAALDDPGDSDATPRLEAGTQTEAGAVAAATAYVGALDRAAILDPPRLRTLVETMASSAAREDLTRAYEQAAAQTRERLGDATQPVILRAAPVGYRLDRFTAADATVSVWRVGIVGSAAAAVEPRQSWRTVTVSLVWEDEAWKVASFQSTPGPTPPLAAVAVTPATDLFAVVPGFEEFTRALP